MLNGLPKGFRLVCQYRVKNGKACDPAVFDENLWQSSGVVYARAWRKKILYIGKTDGKLSGRIRDHFRRIPNHTKKKDVEYRRRAEGKTITIWAYKPEPVRIFGLIISIHAGLEAALIKKHLPRYVSRI